RNVGAQTSKKTCIVCDTEEVDLDRSEPGSDVDKAGVVRSSGSARAHLNVGDTNKNMTIRALGRAAGGRVANGGCDRAIARDASTGVCATSAATASDKKYRCN